jgi:hypothetical protein
MQLFATSCICTADINVEDFICDEYSLRFASTPRGVMNGKHVIWLELLYHPGNIQNFLQLKTPTQNESGKTCLTYFGLDSPHFSIVWKE